MQCDDQIEMFTIFKDILSEVSLDEWFKLAFKEFTFSKARMQEIVSEF